MRPFRISFGPYQLKKTCPMPVIKTGKEPARRAKANELAPSEFEGGTFTISNLGMLGIKNFNSIINPPQSGILSVGACNKRPIVKDEKIQIASIMTLTLAVDHRCIDGVPAAKFLTNIRDLLETPLLLMI